MNAIQVNKKQIPYEVASKSHIGKLVERAFNGENEELENNQIGKLSITPQHGINCYCYSVYKDSSKSLRFKDHVLDIVIANNIRLMVDYDSLSLKEIRSVVSVFAENYKGWKIIIGEIE